MTIRTVETRQEELDAFHLEVFGASGPMTQAPSGELRGPGNELDDAEVLALARANPKFAKLHDTGDWGAFKQYPSRSEAAFYCLIVLAHYTAGDGDQMWSIFREGELWTETCEEKTLKYDIPKAIGRQWGKWYDGGGGLFEPLPRFTFAELAARIEKTDDALEIIGPIADDVAKSGLSWSEINLLHMQIKRKTKVTMASLRADAAKAVGAPALNHKAVAQELIDSFGAGNLLGCKYGTFAYENGLWRVLHPQALAGKTIEVTKSENVTNAVIESIAGLARKMVFRDGHEFDVNRDGINVANGTLYWNGRAWELQPHCREHFRTAQAPILYDPAATAPRFTRFLDEIFRDDADKTARVQLVLEAIGYSLTASCKYEKFILLTGQGQNGKSTLLNVLEALAGPAQVSAVQPKEFQSRFQLGYLHAKLINMVREMADGTPFPDNEIKTISSGELITAENKNQDPFSFRPVCTLWFSCNRMPSVKHFSTALFRRAIVIGFNRAFSDEEKDVNLIDKLRTELPGILNLSLSALGGVFQREAFTVPASCAAAREEWRFDCDTVAQFVKDRCELGPETWFTTSKTLFAAYRTWAEGVGIKDTLVQNALTKELCRLGAKQGTKAHGSVRGLKRIKLRGVAEGDAPD